MASSKIKRLPLTNAERSVKGMITYYVGKNGYAPTRREIAKHLGYQEKSGPQMVQKILNNMEAKGHIQFGKGWRNITIKK